MGWVWLTSASMGRWGSERLSDWHRPSLVSGRVWNGPEQDPSRVHAQKHWVIVALWREIEMSEKNKRRNEEKRHHHTQTPLLLLGRRPTCSSEEATENAGTPGKRHYSQEEPLTESARKCSGTFIGSIKSQFLKLHCYLGLVPWIETVSAHTLGPFPPNDWGHTIYDHMILLQRQVIIRNGTMGPIRKNRTKQSWLIRLQKKVKWAAERK